MTRNTRHALATAALFLGVCLAFAGLADTLAGAQTHTAPTTQVQPAMHSTATPEQFMTALMGAGTDYTPQQAATLTEVAQRVAAQLGHPEQVPAGAETPTRAAMLATFTMPQPSMTTGWTVAEANHFIDTALQVFGA